MRLSMFFSEDFTTTRPEADFFDLANFAAEILAIGARATKRVFD